MKLIEKSIFEKAGKLTRRGFTELKATNNIINCNAVAVCNKSKTFWLTTEKTFKTIEKNLKFM